MKITLKNCRKLLFAAGVLAQMPLQLLNAQIVQTYSYTGSVQNFTVPPGVSTLTVDARGAAGANSLDKLTTNSTGGAGGRIYAVMSVTPGQVFSIYVGGAGNTNGSGGYNGGGTGGNSTAGSGCSGGFAAGGGGASDIRLNGTALTDRIIVAGGGGGSGRDYCNGSCQPCGCGGSGGPGGGLTGGNGAAANNCGFSYGGGGINLGGGGTSSGGGNGGPGDGGGPAGTAGTTGTGGNGGAGSLDVSGGGGGGGYYGGGGGGSAQGGSGTGGGGGAGGSSYANSTYFTSVTHTQGVQAGNGTVVIYYQGETLNFDGSNDYVSVPHNALLNFGTGDLTIEAYFKSPVSQPNYAGIVSKMNGSGIGGIQLVIFNNMLALEFSSSSIFLGVGDGLVGTSTLTNGSWHHVAAVVTRAQNKIELLVDGIVEATVTNTNISGMDLNFSAPLLIGAERTFGALLNGNIDEVRIWKRALCRGEIANNKNAEISISQTSLAAYYKFNHGTAFASNPTVTTLTDFGPSALTGTLMNFALTGSVSNWIGTDAVTNTNVAAFVNPVVLVNSGSICSGNNFTINASGAITYTYSSGSAVQLALTSNTTISVIGTNSLGCLSSMAVSYITVNSNPTLSVNSGSICSGKSFTIVPSGASTYTYSGGSSTVAPTTNTAYNVTGTSSLGCLSTNTAVSTIVVYTLPVVSVNSGSICSGKSFTILPTGANTYTISGGSATVSPLTNTVYNVTGTSTNGCISSNTAASSVSVQTLPVISVNSGTICTGNSFTMVPSGASTYTFSNGSAVAAPLTNTVYSVIGTATSGCVSSNPAVSSVTVNTTPTISVNSGSICAGDSYTMSPSGANTYTYSGGGTAIVAPTTNTSYNVTGISLQGCVSSNTAVSNITVVALPVITVNSGSICTGNSFTINASGASTYTYSGGSSIVAPLTSTVYNVSGTSSVGCVSSVSAVSTITVNITPTISVNSESICSGNSFTMVPSGASTYTFSNGSAVAAPLTNTVYNVIGTATNGCVSSNPAVSSVTVNTTPTISVNSGSICAGDSYTMSPSGANTYTYSGGGTAIVAPTTNTSYNVTGTSLQGCVSSNTAVSNITVVALPVIAVNSGSICTGNSFTINASGASTYTYSGGSSIVAPLTSSVYNVSGTSSVGCVSSVSAVSTITVNITPTISVNSGSICTGNTFVIAASGASTYTYSSGTSTVAPLTTTAYNVTGVSLEGCASSNTAVSSVTVQITPTVSVNSGSICSGNSFTIVASGASTYTYSSGLPVVAPVINSTYNIVGTSAQGCVSSNTAVSDVTVNITPTLSINVTNTTVCYATSLTLTAGGASTYTWNTAATTSSIVVTPTAAVNYTVAGTSAQGCTSPPVVSTVAINQLPLITTNSGSICPGASFSITPGGATSYTYVSASSTLSGISATVSPLVTTNYTIRGTNSNGCISTGTSNAVASVFIFASPSLTIAASPTAVCPGLPSDLTVSGANTYTWFSNATTTLVTVNPTVTTVYSVSGTGTNICNGLKTITVTVNPSPTITINSGTICSGYPFVFIPGGAFTYTFSSGTTTVSPATTTNYIVSGTSALGCISSAPANSTVTVIASPTISALSGTVCPGLSFSLSPSGADTYTLSGSTSTNVVTPVGSTDYSVTGTATNGCISILPAIASVSVLTNPTLTAAPSLSAICIGQATTNITAGGAITYTWNTAVNSGSISVSPSITTVYTVSGTNSLSCISSNTVVIVVNPLPVIAVVASNTFICKGSGSNLTASGAQFYLWNTSNTSPSINVSPLVNTNYTVTGTDALGCVSSSTTSVKVNTITITTSPNSSICLGSTYTLTSSGAATYTWNGNFYFADFPVSPVTMAIYTVNATDINNCLHTGTVSLGVNQLPVVVASITTSLVCIGESVTVTANGASNYLWNTGSTNNSIVVSPTINLTQNYLVTGTDSNGCESTANATLAVSLCNGLTATNPTGKILGIYPNPNNGVLNVELESISEYVSIELFNYLGQLILSEKVTTTLTSLNFKNEANGIYTLRIVSNGNVISTSKLIKQ